MNTNTTTPEDQNTKGQPDQLTQNLIEAAHKLRAHQLAWIRSAQENAALETEKKKAEAALEDAELELAEADCAFATTRLKVLRLIKTKRHHSAIGVELYLNHGNPRIELWRICATGTDAEIIAAAIKLGDHDGRIWENSVSLKEADTALSAAHEEMAVVSAARRAAVQKRGKAKAAVQAAHAANGNAPAEGLAFFKLESNVVSAAATLTGTDKMQFALSYTYTKELGITGPGLELPSEKLSPEDQVRYWERYEYSAKTPPSRDDE